ncbi:hypothetical protein K7A41_19910 [Sphingobacterium sp. InxBP1]|uniref:DUF3226 domain-containing protein n=1 Tax=Sphingobacterium sp. InxBP1 TaxID=2870328 RepID=UPI002244B660|nr:DUF3226 domain-containing protein [Sphingobacterium sp. InxBP1]MCW8313503.1 hypothetical protein [Sphingobacterium sp. InxBP1]
MLKIFCEGIGDQVFIADFIEIHFGVAFERTIGNDTRKKAISIKSSDIEIIPIDGCKNIHQLIIKKQFMDNTEMGGKNLLIFDADYSGVNGNNGVLNCVTMIENLKSHPEHPIEFSHFLWPNNESDGLFENLLEKLIPEENKILIQCLESNVSCLNSLKSMLPIKVPGIKEKINSYLHLFNQPTQLERRTYKNSFWQLDVATCNELKILRDFLEKFIPFDMDSGKLLETTHQVRG